MTYKHHLRFASNASRLSIIEAMHRDPNKVSIRSYTKVPSVRAKFAVAVTGLAVFLFLFSSSVVPFFNDSTVQQSTIDAASPLRVDVPENNQARTIIIDEQN